MKSILFALTFLLSCTIQIHAQQKIIAYYTGDATTLQQYPLHKLTHIIYSFVKLQNDTLMLRDAQQEKTVRELVLLKKKYPQLKIMVSMGGWSGCEPCSDLFASPAHRKTFAITSVALFKKYGLDGIDLDWEYPAIEGFPGHKYHHSDKYNFTELIRALRVEMGNKYILSFAAGGFIKYVYESVEWEEITPMVDFINLMTYDLVGGYATVTGHHTPLHAYRGNQEATDKCVTVLLNKNIPPDKLIIGAAIYARVWEKVSPDNNGLYQTGVFKEAVDYNKFPQYFNDSSGFVYHWDEKAKAPYQYNAEKKLFATFDNEQSIKAKAKYARELGLGGIMFWELILDKPANGLLDVMWQELHH
ncbi:MAG: glycoside hydrolase family 18 protein [Chitinophagaceae bacterium]|jgi:chitinase